jgi:uncharacterized membrane protein
MNTWFIISIILFILVVILLIIIFLIKKIDDELFEAYEKQVKNLKALNEHIQKQLNKK